MTRKYVCSLAAVALTASAGVAAAQTTTPKTEPAPPAMADTNRATAQKLTLTDAQAKNWIDKPVFSSDNAEVGEVVAIKRGPDNIVTEMHADIGGMMGMGETRVKLTPEQFTLQNDRVTLKLTQEQAQDLPKVEG